MTSYYYNNQIKFLQKSFETFSMLVKSQISNVSLNQHHQTLTQEKYSYPYYHTQTQQFFFMKDERSSQEKKRQSKEVQEMYEHNLKTLGIELTSKKKVQYTPAKLFKVNVGNDWYAMITDNQVMSQFTVFTVHGAPGDHREWAGLQKQMNGTIRWINFIIPGFDGLDQRRGNYSGDVDDLSKLITLILQKRKVSKIIYCGHSLGSIFGSYFITKHPEIVKGYINVTGIVNQWYLGLLAFYKTTAYCYGFGKGPNQKQMVKLLDNNQFRQKHHKQFMIDIKDVKFIDKVPFPQLTLTQTCGYIKLLTSLPQGISQLYQLNHKLRLLRMLIFGRNDPLHQIPKTDEQIYSITRGRFRFDGYPQNYKLIRLMKKQIQAKVKEFHGLTIQAQKLQQYFCYNFEDTGHNAHKRRPVQISTVLKVYATVLSVTQKYKSMMETKL